jgi:hypothetical protein
MSLFLSDRLGRFTVAAMLIFLGALPSATFRLASSSGFGPAVLALSFSRSSTLNTPTEYRFDNHGRLVAIRRDAYDRTIVWAVAALTIQTLCWMPACFILVRLYRHRAPLHWRGLALLIVGVVVWLVSEWSSFYGV